MYREQGNGCKEYLGETGSEGRREGERAGGREVLASP